MPTYDYECNKCGHTFDAFQSMSDKPLRKCPECNQNGLKRLIGGGLGVIFKGSGFYVTDSRRSGSAASTSSKPSESTAPEKSGKTEKTEKKDSTASTSTSEKVAG